MRSFLFSLFIVIIFSSCSSYNRNFVSLPKTQEIFTPEFLIQKNIEQVFRIDIEVYGHQFEGILVIKKIENQHYRIAMITEIGAKLLDFELISGEMKLNYVIDPLNRKILLNILKKDFQILLNENAAIKYQYSYGRNTIYRTLLSGKDLYYFINSDSQQLEKIVLASQRKEKIVIEYNYFDKYFPDIKLNHKNIDLKIDFHLLENE